MTPRERFLKTLNFELPDDRLPMVEWAAWWDQTLERWKQEGLPPDITTDVREAFDYMDAYGGVVRHTMFEVSPRGFRIPLSLRIDYYIGVAPGAAARSPC